MPSTGEQKPARRTLALCSEKQILPSELATGMRQSSIYFLRLNSFPRPLERVGHDGPCRWGNRKKETKGICSRDRNSALPREDQLKGPGLHAAFASQSDILLCRDFLETSPRCASGLVNGVGGKENQAERGDQESQVMKCNISKVPAS